MEYQVGLTPRAERDLEGIRAYIARENPAAADAFYDDLLEEAFSLRYFPYRGIAHSRRVGLRKLVFNSYVILFIVMPEERRVEILRFWHGARDPRSLRLREEAPDYPKAIVSGEESLAGSRIILEK